MKTITYLREKNNHDKFEDKNVFYYTMAELPKFLRNTDLKFVTIYFVLVFCISTYATWVWYFLPEDLSYLISIMYDIVPMKKKSLQIRNLDFLQQCDLNI